MSRTERLEVILNHFGDKTQIEKAIEELGELAEILKEDVLNEDWSGDLLSEMADVQIMLDQMVILFNRKDKRFKADYEVMKEYKVDRTERRIVENYYD